MIYAAYFFAWVGFFLGVLGIASLLADTLWGWFGRNDEEDER